LIPFLRYNATPPRLYVGVDLKPGNARWRQGADPRREKNIKTDWGFKRVFIESNVDTMARPIHAVLGNDFKFDLIVYTSSIEHMQPDSQRASLQQCAELGNLLYLTCPISDEGESGYDAQYAAHVYEPSESELRQWLEEAGWTIERRIGLSTKTSKYRVVLQGQDLELAERMYRDMPRLQALPTIATLFPDSATEMSYVCRKES
jgi:hypothetical protein